MAGAHFAGKGLEGWPQGFRRSGGGQEDRQRIVAAVGQHVVGGGQQQAGFGHHLTGDVDRVARAGEGHALQQSGLRGRVGFGQRQAGFLGLVRHQGADPARYGEDAQALALGALLPGVQRIAQVEEVFDAAGAQRAVLAKQRVVDGVVARQRGSVRRGGLRTRLGAAYLGHDHGFTGIARGGQRAAQLGAVAAAFHVGHDDPRVRVMRQPVDAVGHVDVGFVAGADPVRQPQSAFARHAIGIGAERAALRHHADAAQRDGTVGGRGRKRGVDVVAHVHEAQAVGPQQADAAFARDGAKRVLHGRTARARFRKARGEDDRAAHLARARALQRLGGVRGGHGQDDQVHLGIQRGQVGRGGQTLDAVGARVDGQDAAVVTMLAQQADRHGADLAGGGGRAHDGDAARGEQAGQGRVGMRSHDGGGMVQEKRTTLRPMLPRSSMAASACGKSWGLMTRAARSRRCGR
ncbi:hypothetical protein D3C73_831660 [compost metagenome]